MSNKIYRHMLQASLGILKKREIPNPFWIWKHNG